MKHNDFDKKIKWKCPSVARFPIPGRLIATAAMTKKLISIIPFVEIMVFFFHLNPLSIYITLYSHNYNIKSCIYIFKEPH